MKLKNIKDTFDKREIKPSASSWDALASRLDEEEKKSKKPVIYWLGAIAAVLIAAVLIYPALNGNNKVNQQVDGTIVTIEDKDQENSSDVIIPDATEVDQIIKDQQKEGLVINDDDTVEKKEEVISKKSRSQKQYIAQTTQKESVKKEELVQEPNQIIDNGLPQEPMQNTIDDTAIASNQKSQVIEKVLTAEEEMELLLNNAMNKVEQPVIAVKTINPDLLLLETEWDIESDNRSRIQNSIQDGLNFLKTEAVALVDGKD